MWQLKTFINFCGAHCSVAYRICSNISATLIQAPFETYTIFSVLIRGAFADGNYFQAAPILIRTDIATCDIADRYRVRVQLVKLSMVAPVTDLSCYAEWMLN